MHRAATIPVGALTFQVTLADSILRLLSCAKDIPTDCYDFTLTGLEMVAWSDEPNGPVRTATLQGNDGVDATLWIKPE
ncbi:hypothetical protein AB0E69_02995 [Kribbella sp. NPDC026611]|uniref:hypothetical protein n=1 Tax=Kribbella sp. NPDC026611 TaxID=3154911 RepID=UPI0033CCB668